MTTPSQPVESVAGAALYVLTHPWEVFVERWNWKAALLSGLFRGIVFGLPAGRLGRDDLVRILCIEMALRIALGGFWGSLLQSFRRARPAWLAGLTVALFVPAAGNLLEFLAMRAGHATHITASMVVSGIISVGSLVVNLGLMRRGVLVSGGEGASLTSDLRRIPGALAEMAAAIGPRRPSSIRDSDQGGR